VAWVSRSSGVTSARSSCSRTLWSRRSGDIAPDNASPSRSWPRSPRSATDGAVRHIAAKDRTFKTVRLNQGTLTDESKHLESHVWRLEQVIV